ncbi:MAG: O-antigen ligase family protein [Hyphomonadaceae bacterium]
MTVLAETAPPQAAMQTRAGAFERWAGALCVAQCSEPFFNALAQAQGLTQAPGYARLAWAPAALFLGWAFWRDRRAIVAALARAPLLAGLFALALSSALWSIDPGATARRCVWLALTMGVGFYLATRPSWRAMLAILARAWALMAAGAAALAIFAPQIGVMPQEHPGAWSGLWTHKNMLGAIMAAGAPIGVAAVLALGQRRWFVLAAACFALVLLSTSKTSLLAVVLGAGALSAGVIVRRGPLQALTLGFVAAAGALVLGGVMMLAPEALVTLIGRDLTFTGRTDIWAAAAQASAARPWLGYGYGAFWADENGPVFFLREAVGWLAPSAHNGWLELMLGVGRVGLAVFALNFLLTLWRAARALRDPVAGLWAPAFCAAFALYTLSESHILESGNIFWTLYVAVSARLALDGRKERIT